MKEIETFRQMFVKEFQGASHCRLLNVDSQFRDGNYIFSGNAVCAGKQDSVLANVYNSTSPSGQPIKVMEWYEMKIFIDAQSYTVIERVPRR